jgi:hypothetical protein
MMKVSNEHGSSFDVENTVATGFDLLESRRVDGNGRLGRATASGPGLGTTAAFTIAVQRDTSILGMYGSVVTKE